MLFQFAPIIQAGIAAGKYVQVFTSAGVPLGMARDAVTGQFVASAIGSPLTPLLAPLQLVADAVGSPLTPLIAPLQLVMGGVQMFQTHRGFQATYHKLDEGFQETYSRLDVIQTGLQSLHNSVGVLQATTAVIGVGTVAGVALTAVNLHQTLKLRKEVEQMRLDVKNGFIDLKQALKDQRAEIRQIIEQVSQDIKFEQHRLVLIRAYGLFTQAMNRLRSAMKLQDLNRQNAEINAARGMLFEALADYDNLQLLEETCAAGQLRRLECAWAIEQAIATTFQIQNEMSAVSDRLSHLQDKIRKDAINIIDHCKSDDELGFLFPEITRIHNHDLAVLDSWQNHVDWMHSLPPSELQLFNIPEFDNSEFNSTPDATLSVPQEQVIYENLAEKSHFASLRDQLLFLFKSEQRRQYELYISQQAANYGHKRLVPANLQQASDLAVANLYYYFQIRDESAEEVVA